MWLAALVLGAAVSVSTTEAEATADEPLPPVTEPAAADPIPAAPAPTEITATPVGEAAAATAAPGDTATPTAGVEAQVSSPESDGRVWHLRAEAEFHMLAVTDPDPRNDRYMIYRARGDFDLMKGTKAFVTLGMTEKLWAEADESGFLLQDTRLGADYAHELSLDALPLDVFKGKKLELVERAQVYLPTSRASVNQDLYFAPELVSRARFQAMKDLTVGLDLFFQYRFHRYAERAGLDGGMNTQLVFGPSFGLEYTVLEHPGYGTVTVGGDVFDSNAKHYASRESYDATISSQSFWYQDYGWDGYVTYAPWQHTTFVLTLMQGGPVLRDGIVNTFLAKREETELYFWVIATY
ncbi:MAG: hypothetical protein HY903_15740 [Deltaproteobacteria bacterium]|nr:hypothetical protein [Deltaproteobacteria bacterium]